MEPPVEPPAPLYSTTAYFPYHKLRICAAGAKRNRHLMRYHTIVVVVVGEVGVGRRELGGGSGRFRLSCGYHDIAYFNQFAYYCRCSRGIPVSIIDHKGALEIDTQNTRR